MDVGLPKDLLKYTYGLWHFLKDESILSSEEMKRLGKVELKLVNGIAELVQKKLDVPLDEVVFSFELRDSSSHGEYVVSNNNWPIGSIRRYYRKDDDNTQFHVMFELLEEGLLESTIISCTTFDKLGDEV